MIGARKNPPSLLVIINTLKTNGSGKDFVFDFIRVLSPAKKMDSFKLKKRFFSHSHSTD